MRVAIVGAGKLGLKVTAALLGGDHSITVIDKNEDVLSKISQQMDVMTVSGNGKALPCSRSAASSLSIFFSLRRKAMRKT